MQTGGREVVGGRGMLLLGGGREVVVGLEKVQEEGRKVVVRGGGRVCEGRDW